MIETRGVYIRTLKIREKQRLSMQNKHRGELNPNYNGGRSLKTYFCKSCNKMINWQTALKGSYLCASCSRKNKPTNHQLDCECGSCRAKRGEYRGENNSFYGIHKFGENNPNYKPYKQFSPYPLGWTKTFREQIRYRDEYKCRNCQVPEVECKIKLHVHHIDYNKQNLNLNNLISLCHSCHVKTIVTKINKKEYWINYYKDIIRA